MKTVVAVLTQGINLEIHPHVIFVRVYFTGPKTVQMHIEVKMKTRSTTLEASDSQNQLSRRYTGS